MVQSLKTCVTVLLWMGLLPSCDGADDGDKLSSFEGIVLNSNTGEPLFSGVLNVIGYESQSGIAVPDEPIFERNYTLNEDGSFEISIDASSRIDSFSIRLFIDEKFTSINCEPIGCTLMEPNRRYSDMRIEAILDE